MSAEWKGDMLEYLKAKMSEPMTPTDRRDAGERDPRDPPQPFGDSGFGHYLDDASIRRLLEDAVPNLEADPRSLQLFRAAVGREIETHVCNEYCGVRVVSPTDPPRLNEAHLAMLLDEMFAKTPPLYGSSFKERWAQIQAWAATLLPRLTAFVGPTDPDLRAALAWALPHAERAVLNAANAYPAAVEQLERARAALQDSRPAKFWDNRLKKFADHTERCATNTGQPCDCGAAS